MAGCAASMLGSAGFGNSAISNSTSDIASKKGKGRGGGG